MCMECRSGEGMSMLHSMHAAHGGVAHSMCGCGGRRFLSRKEKLEMLGKYRASLESELEGVALAIKDLKEDA